MQADQWVQVPQAKVWLPSPRRPAAVVMCQQLTLSPAEPVLLLSGYGHKWECSPLLEGWIPGKVRVGSKEEEVGRKEGVVGTRQVSGAKPEKESDRRRRP